MQGLEGLRKRRADKSVSQARARKEQTEGKLELSSGHVGLKMINSRLSEEGSIFMKMQRLRFPSHLFPRVLQPLSKSVVLAFGVTRRQWMLELRTLELGCPVPETTPH